MTPSVRRWLGGLVGTPFGLAVLACTVLAGWALWTGGALDGPIAREVRTSSVYVAPGVDLDRAAAQRIIGNRRLVVVLLEPGADLRDACRQVEHAADGTLVLVMSRDNDEYDTYGCALLPDRDDDNFGRAVVAETTVSRGVDIFADRPLEALKVVTVNYDLLVKAGTVPDGARTISPSLPRFMLAAAAVLAVVAGAATLWVGGRRAGRLAAARRHRRDEHADARSALGAAAAVLAQQIIDLDQRYAHAARRGGSDSKFARNYLKLTTDYTAVLDRLAAVDGADEAGVRELTGRVESLNRRALTLAQSRPRARSGRSGRAAPSAD
ncbi:hypothetical protein GA0070606_4721 [Micromonospora citrea]|uniref:Uncharacterized protein n=1 Tax=Micromonospora citrea TaxID=47855 RepID=A0A1C6VPT5_9ACTN|nr:hypothetical protein [Micromonospora citrea]SCL68144.1 hypothetical protein GA0070606_4721 [Micromonospora citrea]